MKKNWIRFCAFILLFASLFLLLNERYRHSDHYRSIFGAYKYENVPYGLQLVNFGTSHGEHAFGYDVVMGYEHFNFATNSQMLYFDYAILDTYQDHLAPGCVVAIPISYHSLYTPVEPQLEKFTPFYARFLPADKIPEYTLSEKLLYHYFPILSAKTDVLNTFAPILNYLTSPIFPGNEDEETVRLGAEYRAEHFYNYMEGAETSVQTQTPDYDEVNAVLGMLELCKQNGWNAVLLTTPFPPEFTDYFPKEFKEKFHDQIEELFLTPYPNAVYFDYSEDELFQSNYQFFADGDHIGFIGRPVFVDMFINDCKEVGFLA